LVIEGSGVAPCALSLRSFVQQKRVQINPQEREEQARQALMKDIDDFINERFVMAQRVICKEGCKKLWHGDVVMTYGASQVVMRILLEAYEVRVLRTPGHIFNHWVDIL
jgi:translation initiation factor 2B subunit (eIF-2B alpha/beta/delta family)